MEGDIEVRERLTRIETTLKSIETTLAALDYVPRPEIMLMRAETIKRLDSLERSRDRLINHIVMSWLAILGMLGLMAFNRLFP